MHQNQEHAYNTITCAEPGCPNRGTILVQVSDTTPLEFCPLHANARKTADE